MPLGNTDEVFSLGNLLMAGDKVIYSNQKQIGDVIEIQGVSDRADSPQGKIKVVRYDFGSADEKVELLTVVDIHSKAPNCGVIERNMSDRYKVGITYGFLKTDSDNYVVIPKGMVKDSGLLHPRNEWVTYGDTIEFILDPEEGKSVGTIEDRFISWGSPSSQDGMSINKVWTKFGQMATWVDLEQITKVIPKEEASANNSEVFNSIVIEILDEIYENFKTFGVMPESIANFNACHLPRTLFNTAVIMRHNNNKMKGEIIDYDFKELVELDKESAKSLLRHIQNNPNYFDPELAYSSVMYDALTDIGVFNFTNTLLADDERGLHSISIFRDGKNLVVFSKGLFPESKFLEQIEFGSRKNFLKFALWQDKRSELIENFYYMLNILVVLSSLYEAGNVDIKHPEMNEEIVNIYLNQLNALENAI